MKRYLPIIITLAVIIGVIAGVGFLFWNKKRSKISPPVLDPIKRQQAEEICKKRLHYHEKMKRCSRRSGSKDQCKEDLDHELEECIHLELIRNAETIEEALAIEQLYKGRPLTPEERLAVTAETMFDEYKLR